MANALSALTSEQFRRAAEIKDQIDSLNEELNAILGGASVTTTGAGKRGPGRPKAGKPAKKQGKGRKKMSAKGRAGIIAGQKARRAKEKVGAAPKAEGKPAGKGKRTMSPEAKAKIAASARKRWAKVKAEGKSKL